MNPNLVVPDDIHTAIRKYVSLLRVRPGDSHGYYFNMKKKFGERDDYDILLMTTIESPENRNCAYAPRFH